MSDLPEEIGLDEALAPQPSDGELVHWMARGPLRLGPAGIAATAAAGFVLGVAAAFGAMAALRTFEPRRRSFF